MYELSQAAEPLGCARGEPFEAQGKQGGNQIGAEERDEGGTRAKWRGKSENAQPPQNHPERKKRALNRRLRLPAAARGDFFARSGEFRPSVSTGFPLSFG